MRRGGRVGPSDPRVAAQIGDGLRLPIGAASGVVRHYRSALTEPRPAPLRSSAGRSSAARERYFCRGLPGDFVGWAVAGWSWRDVGVAGRGGCR